MNNKQKKGSFALTKSISYIIPIVVFLVLTAFVFEDDVKNAITSFADTKQQEMEEAGDLYDNYGEGRRMIGKDRISFHALNIANEISATEGNKGPCLIDLSSEPFSEDPHEEFGDTSKKSTLTYYCRGGDSCYSILCNAQGECQKNELEGIRIIAYYRDDKGYAKKNDIGNVLLYKIYSSLNSSFSGVYYLQNDNKNKPSFVKLKHEKIEIYGQDGGDKCKLLNKFMGDNKAKRFYRKNIIRINEVLLLIDGNVDWARDVKEEDADFSNIPECKKKDVTTYQINEEGKGQVTQYLESLTKSINEAKDKDNCIIKIDGQLNPEKIVKNRKYDDEKFYFGFKKEDDHYTLKNDTLTLSNKAESNKDLNNLNFNNKANFESDIKINDEIQNIGIVTDKDFLFEYTEKIGAIIPKIGKNNANIVNIHITQGQSGEIVHNNGPLSFYIDKHGLFVREYYVDRVKHLMMNDTFLIKSNNNIYFYQAKDDDHVDLNKIEKEGGFCN